MELYEKSGAPLKDRSLTEVYDFLKHMDLKDDHGLAYTTTLYTKENRLIATGSLSGSTIKCVAVAPEFQGQGLLAKILTNLLTEANRQGIRHLFLYTKPINKLLFAPLGFYPVAKTKNVLLMENIKDGIGSYLNTLKAETGEQRGKSIGAIVANCNPFTKGHRYLVEKSAQKCDLLHLFILKDGEIYKEKRMALVKFGTQGIKNLVLHETGDYLVSRVTFPDYFIKEAITEAWYDLDIAIFCKYIVPTLGINRRFVGTEPTCAVTSGYNAALKVALPEVGVEVVEIERMCQGGVPISASSVRQLLKEGQDEAAKALVLPETWEQIKKYYGKTSCEDA